MLMLLAAASPSLVAVQPSTVVVLRPPVDASLSPLMALQTEAPRVRKRDRILSAVRGIVWPTQPEEEVVVEEEAEAAPAADVAASSDGRIAMLRAEGEAAVVERQRIAGFPFTCPNSSKCLVPWATPRAKT